MQKEAYTATTRNMRTQRTQTIQNQQNTQDEHKNTREGVAMMSVIKRGAPAGAAVALLWMLFGAAQALAGMPWWHLTTVSAPASKAGGEAQIIVEASNLGDTVANELNSAVTVRDVLPPGVSATKVAGQGNGISNGEGLDQEQAARCSLEAEKEKKPGWALCEFPKRVGPFERLILVIDVKVKRGAGDGVSEASVSGGFARSAVSSRALALEGPPPPFGVQTYEISPEEEGGAPDTKAGSHPFQLTSTLILNTQAVQKIGPTGIHRLEATPLALTKDLRFNLPPGLVGNPTPIPKCSIYVFTQEAKGIQGFRCPTDTVVGVATSMIDAPCCVGHGPLARTVPLYSLEPAVGEPARFGFDTPVKAPVVIDIGVRTGGDYGAVVSVSNITQFAAVMGSQVTFWGAPSDRRHDGQRGFECLDVVSEPSCPLKEQEQPFLIMPTSCAGAPSTSVEADSWSEPGSFTPPFTEFIFPNIEGEPPRFEPLHFDGCNKLSFKPSIVVTPDGEQASTPTGLTVDVHVPQEASLNPSGLAESAVQSTTVTLPEGVALDASGADGLQACSEGLIGFTGFAEFEPGVKTPTFTATLPEPLEPGVNFCPEAAKVAKVTIHSPLLPNKLRGELYLAAQNANPFGSLIALYLVARDPESGVLIKLAGEVKPDPLTGRLTSTFNSPELPFEDAEIEFFGGSRAPLGTPALCGSYQASASIAPWAENGTAEVLSPAFQIKTGPDGTQATCSDPLPFAPSLTAGSLNLQAGAFTPFTTTMSRQDGQQNLQALQLKMPPGLSGDLSGVELCPEPQASQGACGPNSLIGETIVSVGLGGSPFSVKGGRVYITGPYEGAPFGLSIVNPAKAGPFDVEHDTSNPNYQPACDCVLVRAKIEVDPVTAALTVTSDSSGPFKIPTILDGIPLQIQHVNVTITRPGFTFDPTNCSKMAVTGALTSSEGATSALSVPFQVTNCATLAFKPRFKVSTSGRTSRSKGASLDVKLSYPKAPWGSQANIRSVKVSLPRQLPSRLSTLQKACADTVFDSNPAACPAASRVGQARASTPIIPVPLSGPAYFVSHGGAKFPELIVVLQGYGVTVELHGETFISKGITSSTFKTVPDVPVGTFELKLPQGPDSALAANGSLCKSKLKMPTTFTAQNGLVIHRSTPITTTGCARHRKAPRANHRPHGRGKGASTKRR
jgi:hypothetical protein